MEAHRAEGAVRVVVVDRFPVFDAVPAIVEGRAGRHSPRVEGRCGGDELERRARRVQAGGGTVEQGSCGPACRAPAEDLPEVVLDLARVVPGRCRHREHASRGRLEGDRRPAVAGERPLGDPLELWVDRQHDVVAHDRLARQRVELRAEHRAEAAVRAREVIVERPLEPRARPRLGRVADDVGRERAVRVAPEVERLPVDLPLPVRREHRAVGGDDQAALDLELRDALDRVVLPRREVARRPRLPVRGADDEHADQRQRDERDPADLGVHRARASARFETSSSPASMTKLATTLDPP